MSDVADAAAAGAANEPGAPGAQANEPSAAERPSGTPYGPNPISRDARQWAMICHLSALVGLLGNGIGFLLGPLVVWLIKREDDPFIDEQGKEAVNFQLTMFLLIFVSILFLFVLIGIPMLIAVGLLAVINPIIAAIKSSDGEHYRYPFSIRFMK